MSVIPAAGVTQVAGFLQRLSRALDRHAAERARSAVPARALRRCNREVDRCRRLMSVNSRSAGRTQGVHR
jgi:hypothetical protein